MAVVLIDLNKPSIVSGHCLPSQAKPAIRDCPACDFRAVARTERSTALTLSEHWLAVHQPLLETA